MKVCDFLNVESINLKSKADTKREAIKDLVKAMKKSKNLNKVGEFQKVVIETEEKENVDTSKGYAVLYGKTDAVNRLALSAIVVKDEIDFNSNAVQILFLVAAPDNKSETYLDVVNELNDLLSNEELRDKLIYSKTTEDFMNLLFDSEVKADEVEIIEENNVFGHLNKGVSKTLPFILTGSILLVLSFLFDNFGVNPNNLGLNTPFAAFFNMVGSITMHVMMCLLAAFTAKSVAGKEGFAVGFIGGFLGNSGVTFNTLTGSTSVVSAGFIGMLLIGLGSGYLMKYLKKLKLFNFMDNANCNLLYTFISILVISLLTVFFINPCAALINQSVIEYLGSIQTANKVLLGAVLGGMVTIDLCGPIGSAAYAFGLTTIANGHYDIMAAIMAAAMVPPLAMAILATFFPNRFEGKDREVGLLNYIFGLAGITESAIYYAGKDLKTIPAFVVGGICASVASIIFTCTLKAPYGGLFALSALGHPILYLIAVLFGAVVGALILLVLKEENKEN